MPPASESWGRSSSRNSLCGDSSDSPLLSYCVGMIWMWTGLQGDLAILVPVYSASFLPPPPGIVQEPCASAAPVCLQWDSWAWKKHLPCTRAPRALKTAAWPPLLYSVLIVCSLKTKCPARSHWKEKVCVSCRSFTCKRIYFHISFPLALLVRCKFYHQKFMTLLGKPVDRQGPAVLLNINISPSCCVKPWLDFFFINFFFFLNGNASSWSPARKHENRFLGK